MNKMKSSQHLFNMLQISSGTFPSGGFSHSRGLETYVQLGEITDGKGFARFLATYLEECIGNCEGPILCRAHELALRGDFRELKELEELSVALKVTEESRSGALKMGKAVLRIMREVLGRDRTDAIEKSIGKSEITYPVIYGTLCGIEGIPIEETMASYAFAAANGLVQSAVKLIPLGNTEAQVILHEASELMDKVTEHAIKTPVDEVTNFSPGIDIAGLKHEKLPVRLYMS